MRSYYQQEAARLRREISILRGELDRIKRLNESLREELVKLGRKAAVDHYTQLAEEAKEGCRG